MLVHHEGYKIKNNEVAATIVDFIVDSMCGSGTSGKENRKI